MPLISNGVTYSSGREYSSATKVKQPKSPAPAGTTSVAPTGSYVNGASPELQAYLNTAGVNYSAPNWNVASGDATGGALNIEALNKIAKNRITSSSTALDQRDAQNAVTGAGNQLTGGLTGIALNNFDTGMQETQGAYKDLMDATKLVYDSKLAQTNHQYASLMQDLETQKNQQVQIAESNAAALNPYSQARGAQTSANFTNAIVSKYNDQAIKLQQQADLAQQALAANQAEAYAQITNSMAQSNQKFRSEMLNFMQDQQKMQQQQSQWEAGYGLNVAQFGLAQDQYQLSKETKATDDFRAWMTTLSGSPELQQDIENYFQTGQITDGLKPIIQQAGAMGLSPDEALGIFQYQTDAVRKQQALENYRMQQQSLATLRMAQATENQTAWQATLAATQQINSVQQQLAQEGIKPGTVEYANRIANASLASPRMPTASQVAKYTQFGVLTNKLSSLRDEIQNVNENSALYNIAVKYAGKDVSSMLSTDIAILNAEITAMSGLIGKSLYGESGNLSNTDIQRILNALPTSGGTQAVRNGLYNGLMDVVSDNAILTLQNDASAGYNVANYAQYATVLATQAEEAKIKGGQSNVTVEGANELRTKYKY